MSDELFSSNNISNKYIEYNKEIKKSILIFTTLKNYILKIFNFIFTVLTQINNKKIFRIKY